jgi:hypothetical protein
MISSIAALYCWGIAYLGAVLVRRGGRKSGAYSFLEGKGRGGFLEHPSQAGFLRMMVCRKYSKRRRCVVGKQGKGNAINSAGKLGKKLREKIVAQRSGRSVNCGR